MGSFGQLLRQLRTSAGLSQEELARGAELSTRAVSDLERGINLTARGQTARLLAGALGLSGADRAAFLAAARGADLPAGLAAARALPRDTAAFTGRAAELRQLQDAAGAGGIVVIGGMAGAGKTALAIRAARQLAPATPTGRSSCRCTPTPPASGPPRPPPRWPACCRPSGSPPGQIPPSPDARASLWRDRVAGQRLLLVLDDAASSDQVRPLLPGTAGALVLITSPAAADRAGRRHRHQPGHLAARRCRRAAGPPGGPARPGPRQTRPLPRSRALCGFLPLALGMAARQLYHHPAWTPADLAADLAAARDRAALIHAEDLSVAAALDRSYQDLTAAEQHMFPCLGLHPGTDIDAWAAAALAGVPVSEARRELEGLYDHYLLTETARGRYRFHDLIRQHARALAAARPPADRDAAITRLLDYYLHTARAAARHLDPRPAPGAARRRQA